MPKGMQMMLKAMGIDANSLMGGYKEAAEKFKEVCNHFDASLKRIEANQTLIMEKLGVENPNVPKAVGEISAQEKGTGTNG